MLLSLMMLTACDELTCNLMYAPDTLIVTVQDADPASLYALSFTGDDGTTISCAIVEAGTTAYCDDNDSAIGFDGTDLVVTLWAFVPDTIDATVSLDGASVLEWSFSPEYAEDEPNGEGCGFRRNGAETVSL